MLLVGGGEGDALSGIQNITIIMAAPFGLVMVLICVALARDLRNDPLVRRGLRSAQAIEQAVEFGERAYGDAFYVPVKPHPIERPLSVDTGHEHGRSEHGRSEPARAEHGRPGRHAAHDGSDGARDDGTPHAADVPAQGARRRDP
jgi:hypothetical protein